MRLVSSCRSNFVGSTGLRRSLIFLACKKLLAASYGVVSGLGSLIVLIIIRHFYIVFVHFLSCKIKLLFCAFMLFCIILIFILFLILFYFIALLLSTCYAGQSLCAFKCYVCGYLLME